MNDNTANTLNRFWQLPLGIQLAAAALVVAVPRYVIAFLAADNLRFPSLVEGLLLGVSAIATAVIVAGGGAYTAHVVSSAQGQAGKRALLLALWLVLLACEIVLLAPPVVASLRKSELAAVLLAQFYFDALWSVVMVATPALCAAACVLAASLDKRATPPPTRKRMQPVRIVRSLRRKPRVATPAPAHTSPQSEPLPVAPAPVLLHCPNECGKSYASQQALAGHLRYCNAQLATQSVAVSANGNGAH